MAISKNWIINLININLSLTYTWLHCTIAFKPPKQWRCKNYISYFEKRVNHLSSGESQETQTSSSFPLISQYFIIPCILISHTSTLFKRKIKVNWLAIQGLIYQWGQVICYWNRSVFPATLIKKIHFCIWQKSVSYKLSGYLASPTSWAMLLYICLVVTSSADPQVNNKIK